MTAALAFETVRLSFRGRPALDGVSAAISDGMITGIVGPNGAGKTTLLRAALGLIPLASGSILIRGKPLGRWRREALAREVAYLPQGGEAKWPMTAADVVMLGRLPHLPRFAKPSAEDEKAAVEALERTDATRFSARRMNELSAGERSRVLLARALATHAGILLADEPAAFLDPVHQLRLMDILKAEAGRGAAVAVTLHDLTLAARHCDRLIVLCDGKTAAEGTPDAALTEEILARVFAVAPDGKAMAFRRI